MNNKSRKIKRHKKLTNNEKSKQGASVEVIRKNNELDVSSEVRPDVGYTSSVTIKDYSFGINNNSKALKMCNNTRVSSNRKKRLSVNVKLKNALWIWYNQQRSAGLALTNAMLKNQAISFAEGIQSSEDDNWLDKWKEKKGISNLLECGLVSTEQVPIDRCNALFMQTMKSKNLTQDQIFTCCESTFSYKSLPRSSNSKTCYSINDTKRITFFTCSNASGSFKLPLVIIGKLKQPKLPEMPVCWKEHPNSWLTIDIFRKWFQEDFVPQVSQFLKNKGLPNKAWLITDSCYERPNNIREGGIKAELLSNLMLPLTKSIDESNRDYLKKLYRQKFMLSILDNYKQRGNVENYLKTVELKDCICWLSEAWREIPPHVIQYWWQQLWKTEANQDNNLPHVEDIESGNSTLKEDSSYNDISENHIIFETCIPSLKYEIDEAEADISLKTRQEKKNERVINESTALRIHSEVETQALISLIDRFLEVLRSQIDNYQQLKRIDICRWLNEATRVDNENLLSNQDIISLVLSNQEDLENESDDGISEESSDESLVLCTDSASNSNFSDSDNCVPGDSFDHSSNRKRKRSSKMSRESKITRREKHRECYERIKHFKAAYKREKLLRIAAEDALSYYQTTASPFSPSIFESLNEIKHKLDLLRDKEREIQQQPVASALTVSMTNPIHKSMEGNAASSCMLKNVQVQNDYVHLGEDCWCTVSSWFSMCQATSANHWAISLLKGVFGEDAKYYRMKPRKPGLRPFPANFLSIAHAHYRMYLLRLDYPREEVELRLKKLPALLADRALDMNGRRQKRPRGVDAQMSIFNEAMNRERDLQINNDNHTIMLNEITGEIMNVDTMDTATLAKRLGADCESHETQLPEADYATSEIKSHYSKKDRLLEREDFDA